MTAPAGHQTASLQQRAGAHQQLTTAQAGYPTPSLQRPADARQENSAAPRQQSGVQQLVTAQAGHPTASPKQPAKDPAHATKPPPRPLGPKRRRMERKELERQQVQQQKEQQQQQQQQQEQQFLQQSRQEKMRQPDLLYQQRQYSLQPDLAQQHELTFIHEHMQGHSYRTRGRKGHPSRHQGGTARDPSPSSSPEPSSVSDTDYEGRDSCEGGGGGLQAWGGNVGGVHRGTKRTRCHEKGVDGEGEGPCKRARQHAPLLEHHQQQQHEQGGEPDETQQGQ
ncbi:hypothetical protein DUNSADRAFT_11578, partial [Dunaliella salina]